MARWYTSVKETAMAASPLEIRHLLARTGFGVPTPAEIAALSGLEFADAVDRVLAGVAQRTARELPDWAVPLRPAVQPRGMTQAERQALQRQRVQDGNNLKAWWWSEMLATPTPFTEHMVLFWHNHFTSSLRKVRLAPLLASQNHLLRTHATGNFATLLRAVARDPAMLVYLDNNLNRAAAPNENFARELLELFTLGEGQGYTELDIREAARAFTGWRFRPDGAFVGDARMHDTGTKTFLGERGNFDGDDILNIVLKQPRVAEHITERLWREFVSDSPDPRTVARLAASFRRDYELRPLLQGLLTSDAFRDADARGGMVKSPVDLIVGTFRLLGATPREPRVLAVLGRTLGQDLFDPPNVKGWPGGVEWVDTANLPSRHAFLFSTAETLALIENPALAGQQPLPQPQRPQLLQPQRPPLAPGQPGQPGQPGGPAAAALLRRQQLQAQGQLPGAVPAPGMADEAAMLQGLPPQLGRPGALGQPQFNPRNLDVTHYRALRSLTEPQLAAVVLPLPPVGAEDGTTTALGRLLLDPTYQLK
jgi:uncharacterized protein (DUF1800 family)